MKHIYSLSCNEISSLVIDIEKLAYSLNKLKGQCDNVQQYKQLKNCNFTLCTYVCTPTVQVTLNLNAHKMCIRRKLTCDMLVAYETHVKPRIRKDTCVLAYIHVYCHVHTTSTITCMCVVTTSKHLYKKKSISKV